MAGSAVTIPASFDVLVVGAGPAGAVTAAVLAGRGLRVLLVDRGAAATLVRYDLMVTGPALRGLKAAGIPALSQARPIGATDLRFGPASHRVVASPGEVVCDQHELRQVLHQAAADAGAYVTDGTVRSPSRVGDAFHAVVHTGDTGVPVDAQHVVLATGSAVEDGLTPASAPHTIGITCVRRFTGVRLGDRMTLLVVAPASIDADAQPACVWALPGGDGSVTIGTARVGRLASPAKLMSEAINALVGADVQFADVSPAGPLTSGPLNTGFTPARVAKAEFLLVGDAAGLVNPFTGEGLSYAVQSGLIAARAIASKPSDPDAARRRYARKLAATFVGYFETARHAARRYHLAWRVLAAGADSDHPFFAKGRRAILLPEGFSGLTAEDRLVLPKQDLVLIKPFLVACDEVVITTVRGEWPFLGRLAIAGETLGDYGLRPAIPFFAALIAAGRMPDVKRATVAAAIELGLLGSLALMGPAPAPTGDRGVDWALTSTLLAGDFLLAQASRLIAESAPQLSWSFADWLAELAAIRTGRLHRPGSTPAGALYASLFEFPSRIGALLGRCSPETIRALRDFGHHCGYAFVHTEDMLSLRGERTRLDTTLDVMLNGQFSAIPDSLDAPQIRAETLATDPELRSRALTMALDGCDTARQRALLTLTAVPNPTTARILREFIDALAAPASTGWWREPGRTRTDITTGRADADPARVPGSGVPPVGRD
jgi:menaquinone-9 beta-reductase